MLPFHLPLWETDATLRAAIQQSVQVSVAPLGVGALLAGGELSGDARAAGPRSLYTAEGRARYARAFDLTGGPPEDDLEADASAAATWTLSPLSSLSLTAQGSLATTWGIRADSLLLQIDPFLEAPRLEYGAGADLAYTITVRPRAELSVDAGVEQDGALASPVPAVVGMDSREAHGGVAYSLEVGPRLSITPEVRYAFTHYTHAMLDIERPRDPADVYALSRVHRGPADIHAFTFSLGASREIVPRLFLNASAGVTAGSPMPILATHGPVIAPEAGLGLRWRSRRAQLDARYTWAYRSLGPRVGYGQQHAVTLKLMAWPFGRSRVLLRSQIKAAYGAAPLGEDPQPALPGLPPPPTTGNLLTTSLAGRTVVEIPAFRGWSVTAGIDLVAARGQIDALAPQRAVTGMLTIGLAGTVSTDRRRLFPRDPGADEDDAIRRGGVTAVPEERVQDRTVVDDGRGDDE